MKYKALLETPALITALLAVAPASKFSGKPLTLSSSQEGLSLSWENCMESDWWVGANDGIYTRQDCRTVTDEEINIAAANAGLDASDVATAIVSRVQELAELDARRNASAADWSRQEADKNEARKVAALKSRSEQHPELLDKSLAAAAEQELSALFQLFPQIDRMTRKLALIDRAGNQVANFTNRAGMLAWLFQNGHMRGVDDRQAFVDFQK